MRGDTLDYASFLSRRRQRGEGDSPSRTNTVKIIRRVPKFRSRKEGPDGLSLHIRGHGAFSVAATKSRAGIQRVHFAKTQIEIICPACDKKRQIY